MDRCAESPQADLIIGEEFLLEPDPAGPPARLGRGARSEPDRADRKAFEVHTALREMGAAGHAADVCLSRLLGMMSRGGGFRAWGQRSLGDYLTEELRQSSPRRLRYLAAIDNAIVSRGLHRLADAWGRGDVGVSQAREIIRVATSDNEERWLEVARSSTSRQLHDEVQRALSQGNKSFAPVMTGLDGDAGPTEPAEPGEPGEDDSWRRVVFSATVHVDAGWQAFLETSRRMAGFDAPVHRCVEDLLAEYASGCTLLPDEKPAAPAPPGGADAGGAREAWHHARHVTEAAGEDLELLRRAGRGARLAADPLEGLGSGGAEPEPQDIHMRIRWVLRVQQRIAWHQMRLVRVMAGSKLYARLGFGSFARYAESALDMAPRTVWGLVALGRLLDRYPKVERAFLHGEVTVLEATEVCRAARAGTQEAWLARARTCTLQQLREDVSFVVATDDPTGLPPARPLPRGVTPCPEVPAPRPGCAAVPRARLHTRAPATSGTTGTTVSHRTDLWHAMLDSHPRAAAERMLSPVGRTRPVMFSGPESLVVQWRFTLGDCRTRMASQVPDKAASGACVSDSQVVAILLLNFMKQWASPEILKAARGLRIFTRDGWRCQVPRCRSRAHLNAHHIVFRSHNGPDHPWNMITVCRTHHEALHAGRIAARGRAPGGVAWAMGVNSKGDVRERFVGGTRVEINPGWVAGSMLPAVRSGSDWRAACGRRDEILCHPARMNG